MGFNAFFWVGHTKICLFQLISEAADAKTIMLIAEGAENTGAVIKQSAAPRRTKVIF